MLDRYNCYWETAASERLDQRLLYVNVLKAGASGEIAASAQTKGMHNKFIVDPVGVQALIQLHYKKLGR